MPYIDERNAYRLIDHAADVYSSSNAQVRSHRIALLACPSEPDELDRSSSYAGCHHHMEAPIDVDNTGLLFLNSHVRRQDITDGASHTLAISEKRAEPDDLGWMSGTRATLRNTGLPPNSPGSPPGARQPTGEEQTDVGAAAVPANLTYVGPFGSAHTGGTFAAFADGSVRFVFELVDPQVWQQLGHRADGKLLEFDSSD